MSQWLKGVKQNYPMAEKSVVMVSFSGTATVTSASTVSAITECGLPVTNDGPQEVAK